jgi:transcriptional regulator
MYNYPHYKEKDKEKILAFMRENSFISLIGTDAEGRIELTQVPVLVDETEGRIVLKGHIARKSDHHSAFEDNADVLALFTGPHVYVSGSWYTGNPHQASTWNYISVHARGKMRFLDEAGLITFLKRLTLHYENGNTDSTTVYDNLPGEYLQKLIKAIVAFEIVVDTLEDVHKLSQNRDRKSYENIILQLEQQGADGQYIAGRMRENIPAVFGTES